MGADCVRGYPVHTMPRNLLVFASLTLAALAQEPAPAARTAAAPKRPNFVFLLAEGTGAGWSSTSVAMDDRLPEAKGPAGLTPSLERLAKEGVRFGTFYVSAPRCTPARATLLTGKSAATLHMTYVNETGSERRGAGDAGGSGGGGQQGGGGGLRGGQRGGGGGGGGRNREAAAEEPTSVKKLLVPASETQLPAGIPTIASLLREEGYATAHFGKWHVGRLPPSGHGFDVDDGANTNQGPGRDPKPNPEQAYAITDRGIAFARAQVKAGKPFYLQLSHYGGGSEDESRPETRQALAEQLRGMRGKGAWQAAILADVDANLGRVLAALDELGIADETYVVFSTDHGAAGRNANPPLRGGKGSVLEGGVRVPFLVRGPGVAAGACTHARASGEDLLPTVLELAGVKRTVAGIEGASLAAVLRDPKAPVQRTREEFVVHFPHYDLGSTPASAIWVGTHKLVRSWEDESVSLYDLAEDPAESKDLAGSDPKRVKDLTQRLDAWLAAIKAAMPKPNPDYGK